MRYRVLLLFLAGFFLVGCPKRQTVNQPVQEPAVQSETAKPFPEEPAPQPAATTAPPPQSRWQPVSGWRVQIFVSGTKENARRVAEEARWKFLDQQIFVAEQPPYYKVQVGNGLSRQAAENLKQKAKELGYQDAFAVEVVY